MRSYSENENPGAIYEALVDFNAKTNCLDPQYVLHAMTAFDCLLFHRIQIAGTSTFELELRNYLSLSCFRDEEASYVWSHLLPWILDDTQTDHWVLD